MKSFIKSEESIVSEILNKDFNYRPTIASFIDKTLKSIDNIDIGLFKSLDKYIDDEDLLHHLHKMRIDGNELKHHSDDEFDEKTALNDLEIVNKYIKYFNKNYPNVVEVVDILKLYEQKKKEFEKKTIVEKRIPVVRKEIVTIEKPVYKEINKKDINNVVNNDYTEVQLLNEDNHLGLFINALKIESYDYALDILLKKINHDIKLNANEISSFNEHIDKFYKYLVQYLHDDKVFSYFKDAILIDLLFKSKDLDLVYKYISTKPNYNLENDHLNYLLRLYVKERQKEALKVILKYKDVLKPIDKLRLMLGKELSDKDLANFINGFEDEEVKEILDFKIIEEYYHIKISESFINTIKKYKWGMNIICKGYIDGNKKISDEIFKECYLKGNNNIYSYLLTSKNNSIDDVIKRMEEQNVSFKEIYNNSDHSKNISSRDLAEKVNIKIIMYFIQLNIYDSDTSLKIFKEALYDIAKNEKIIEMLIDIIDADNEKIKDVFLSIDNYTFLDNYIINNDSQIYLINKMLLKYNNVPYSYFAKCFDFNYSLSCKLFSDFIYKDIVTIFTKNKERSYPEYGYGRYREKKEIYYFFKPSVIIHFFNRLIDLTDDRNELIKYFDELTVIIHKRMYEFDDNSLLKLIIKLNSKSVFLYDAYESRKKNHEIPPYFYEFFEDIVYLNNFNTKIRIPVFGYDFIISHYNNDNIDILINNCISLKELLRKIILYSNYEEIKTFIERIKDYDKCFNEHESYYDGKYTSALAYYLGHHDTSTYRYDKRVTSLLALNSLKKYKNTNKKDYIKYCTDKSGKDLVDILLADEENNKEALEYLKENFNLMDKYKKFLEKNDSENIEVFKKKLFIDKDYLNNENKYDELLSFNVKQINKLNIDSNTLIKMHKYYDNTNNYKKMWKVEKIKNDKFKEYLDSIYNKDALWYKLNELNNNTNIKTNTKTNSINKNNTNVKTNANPINIDDNLENSPKKHKEKRNTKFDKLKEHKVYYKYTVISIIFCLLIIAFTPNSFPTCIALVCGFDFVLTFCAGICNDFDCNDWFNSIGFTKCMFYFLLALFSLWIGDFNPHIAIIGFVIIQIRGFIKL